MGSEMLPERSFKGTPEIGSLTWPERAFMVGLLTLGLLSAGFSCVAHGQTVILRNAQLSASVRAKDGAYLILAKSLPTPVLISQVGAEVDHRWLSSGAYPHHRQSESAFGSALGAGRQVTVRFTGLKDCPELDYVLRLYQDLPYGDIQVDLKNTTGRPISVQAIRVVEAVGRPVVNLGGPEAADRVLPDSFSEDRPPVHIYDLGEEPVYLGWDQFGKKLSPVELGVGSQLIYNRDSKQSLLLAALTSHRWLTLLRLGVSRIASGSPAIGSYDVDSTGTTEIEKRESLRGMPAADQIQLSLPLAPGGTMPSERLMFAAGPDYHAQLEAYGRAIRVLHKARVNSPNLMGWWSWTSFYNTITEKDVSENAHWLAGNLSSLGYDHLLIDEGYDYTRGEYTKPDLAHFPHGMRRVGLMLRQLGLKLGVWTAPFEVSEKALVYRRHKDWLVHQADGAPLEIHQPDVAPLYVLDATNPGAQKYLRQTYRTMVKSWGIKFVKLDFMDDTAVEGYRYRPNTTALEAQRIGLRVIRDAVGPGVLIDKDGSPMLNPVGIVDEGRISLDSSHLFQNTKDQSVGIAARFYMNRNFFVSDPDAFAISKQVQPHQSAPPLTLNEAETSIVMAALSGGMFEIGDNLPFLATEPARLALLKNADLLQIVRLGKPAIPLDLMSYRPQDEQPSIFLLRESKRQTMLAVFNWTDGPRSHEFSLSALGLTPTGAYKAFDSLNRDEPVSLKDGVVRFTKQAPHSVRLIKIIGKSIPASRAR